MNIKVHAQVPVRAVDGKDTPIDDPSIVHVNSHWNQTAFVMIQIDDGAEFTVDADRLIDAIRRCSR